MKHAIGWKDLQDPLERAKAYLGTRHCAHPQTTFKFQKWTDLRATFARIRKDAVPPRDINLDGPGPF